MAEEEPPSDTHRKLRAARVYAGLEIRELAAQLDYHPSHWSAVERGAKGLPKPAVIARVAEITGVPLDFIEAEGFTRYEGSAAVTALEGQVAELAAGLAGVQRTLVAMRSGSAAQPKRVGPGAAAQGARRAASRPKPVAREETG